VCVRAHTRARAHIRHTLKYAQVKWIEDPRTVPAHRMQIALRGSDELQHRHAVRSERASVGARACMRARACVQYPRMWMAARTPDELVFDESVQVRACLGSCAGVCVRLLGRLLVRMCVFVCVCVCARAPVRVRVCVQVLVQ
jgi:hypothetical protein